MNRQEILETIMALKTDNGGWRKEDLERLGVAWPPRQGWIDRLVEECDD